MRVLTLLTLLLSATFCAFGQEVIIYGQNAPEWNKMLGATATRGSCSNSPEDCMKNAVALMGSQHTDHFYRNLPEDADKTLTYASFYSKASLAEPRLVELDLDDFPDHFNIWCQTPQIRCDRFLNEVIDDTKSSNPKLRFGLTIYEDQLASLLSNPKFTRDLRRRIDSVHLYLHDRENGPKFDSYVKQIKENFPNARIYGGSYPYDRLNYEKCRDCAPGDARDMQKNLLRDQVKLYKEGAIAGFEFYPGHFGWEEKWPSWNDPKVCAPARKQQCIDDTKSMHSDAVSILRTLKE